MKEDAFAQQKNRATKKQKTVPNINFYAEGLDKLHFSKSMTEK